ncbi:MAG: hypothetical protein QOK40_776 [Miltoncostaeaceae bacterium]|nr:hypothetical protein [Miltoncostaeaceae bacterium]
MPPDDGAPAAAAPPAAPLGASALAPTAPARRLARLRGWTREHPTRAIALGLFLFLLGLYALSAGGHTYSSDEEGFFQQARALLDGRAALHLTPDEGGVTSTATGRDGVVGGGGIGLPVAAAPLVAVGRAVGALAPSALEQVVERLFAGFTNSWVTAALAVVVLLGCLELGAGRRDALLLALAFGVGTAAWPHAKTLFSEPLTALLVAIGVVAAIRAASGRGRLPLLAALAGLSACAALMARISAGPFVPIIGIYLTLVTLRRAGLRTAAIAAGSFVAGAVPSLAALLLTNRWRIGDAAATGYGAVPFNRGLLDGFYNLFLTPGKSLFLYAPIALVALIAAPFAARRRAPETLLLLALIAANTVIFGRFQAWSGDHAWGPRYMYIVLPLFALLIAPVVSRVPWRRAVLVAAMIGVASATVGTALDFNQYIAHVSDSVTGPPVDGEPGYAYALHHDVGRSPVLGQPKLIDDAVARSAADVDRAGQLALPSPFPATTNERYFWYFRPPRLDAWWLWVFPERLPLWLLLMAPAFLALSVVGARGLRRGLEPERPAGATATARARWRVRPAPGLGAALGALAALSGGVVVAVGAVRGATAPPPAGVAVLTRGFGPVERDGDAVARWLQAPQGLLEITTRGAARPRAIQLTLLSFARPRRVALSLDGRPLGSVPVSSSSYGEVTVPLGRLAAGRHTIILRPTPGVQSIHETTGSADTRSVSIRLREPAALVDGSRAAP